VINPIKRCLIAGSLLTIGLTGCVSQSKYDDLQAQNQQLQQQNASLSQELAANKAQVSRLQGAIKYTVNSDLLFAPGSWEMRPQGKQIIARMAAKLAPTQQNKILVNGYTDNTPVGPELQRQGITSNQDLSQKRAESVMAFLISQGVKPDLVEAHGYGDAQPVASNNTAKGRSENRRVELTLANTGG
jgi:chemotaxis protein MotB